MKQPAFRRRMFGRPIARISSTDLDSLIKALEVRFVGLTECLISPGGKLAFDQPNELGLHYVLRGGGQMMVGDGPPIDLLPHTLIITPGGQPFVIKAPTDEERLQVAEEHWQKFAPDAGRKFISGNGAPALQLVCGCFSASLGSAINLLSAFTDPIAEQFAAGDQIDRELTCAARELLAQEIGAGAFASASLKQVLVRLFRRSLSSHNLWVERFAVVGDSQIALAFTEMSAKPGTPHTVQSLSRTAGLSRSVFMTRFAAVFGSPPLTILRQLRMRQAAYLLANGDYSIDQICCELGYASRSSFFRAFHKSYKDDPMEHRDGLKCSSSSVRDDLRSEATGGSCG